MATMPKITLDVRGMPEVIADIRHEVADLLREAAGACLYPEAARELRAVAVAIEAGLRRIDGVGQ